MTPLMIDIMLWYYTRSGDYREGDLSAPAVDEAVRSFVGISDGPLLKATGCTNSNMGRSQYQITERGRAYVEALMQMPLPVQMWVMPKGASPS